MSPCVIKKDGRFFEAVGSPGGSTIITTVLQNFLNAALFDMDIQKATDAARFHHQWLPDQIDYEEGALSSSVLSQLESMGYKLNKRPRSASSTSSEDCPTAPSPATPTNAGPAKPPDIEASKPPCFQASAPPCFQA